MPKRPKFLAMHREEAVMHFFYFYQCLQWVLGVEKGPVVLENMDHPDFKQYVAHHQLELFFSAFLYEKKLKHLEMRPWIQTQLRFKQYLFHIARLFEEQGIDYVVLKGLPLNQLLYGDSCVRQFKDIDLLISLSMLDRAHACLLSLGFELYSEFGPDDLKACPKRIYIGLKDLSYVHVRHKVEVELHWRTTITDEFGFTFEDIENNKQWVCIENRKIPTLDNEYLFVYLCIHGAVSHWRRLKWLVDLAVFIQKKKYDWQKILAIATQHHALRCVLEAHRLLKELGLPMPNIQSSSLDRLSISLHVFFIHRLWRICDVSAPIEQLFQLLLHPDSAKKRNFFINRLLFSSNGRQKLLNHPDHPLWKLFL